MRRLISTKKQKEPFMSQNDLICFPAMTYMVEGTQYQTYNCFVLKEPDTEKDKGTKLTAPPSIVKPTETDPAPAG